MRCDVGFGMAQTMGEGWEHNDVAKRLLEVALCASGRLGLVAYPGKPPTVIDEVFGHFIATVNPLVSGCVRSIFSALWLRRQLWLLLLLLLLLEWMISS